MNSRKKMIAIKNIAELEHRPARQFLDICKSMVQESLAMLQAQPVYYRVTKSKFESLVTSCHELENILLAAEQARAPFVCHQELELTHSTAVKKAETAAAHFKEIDTGVIKRDLQNEIHRLTSGVHEVQMNVVSQQSPETISAYRHLATVEMRLHFLRNKVDDMDQFYVSRKKRRLAEQAVTEQSMLVAGLKSILNKRHDTSSLDDFQRQLTVAKQDLKNYLDHEVKIKSDAYTELTETRRALTKVESEFNHEVVRHYSNLDSAVLHGIIRIYESFVLYKLAFDIAVKDRINNKNGVSVYQQQLDARKSRLDHLLDQFWCQDVGKLTANDIRAQLGKMHYKDREKFLTHKPDGNVLMQMLGQPRVSASGLFNRPLTTAEKRKYLVRTDARARHQVTPKL